MDSIKGRPRISKRVVVFDERDSPSDALLLEKYIVAFRMAADGHVAKRRPPGIHEGKYQRNNESGQFRGFSYFWAVAVTGAANYFVEDPDESCIPLVDTTLDCRAQ